MADHSSIEWTDATWTPIRARNRQTGKLGWHCEHDTTGCVFCYAEGFNKRLGTGLPFKPGHRKDIDIFLDEEMLTAPLRWKKPRMIFVCSMTDLFADFVPDEWIDRVFAVMALAPQHSFQVLTKRAKRMREYFSGCDDSKEWVGDNWLTSWHRRDPVRKAIGEIARAANYMVELGKVRVLPLPNVWLGVSAERQQEADERIPELLATPAAVRFVSAEPLLGPIDFGKIIRAATFAGTIYPDGKTHPIGWMIAGGESGPGARPMHPDWVRQIRDDFVSAGVPFFFKQWGAWAPPSTFAEPRRFEQATVLRDGRVREWDGGYPASRLTDPEMAVMWRGGKKAAGRMLDGVEHNAMPEVR
ncbi:phage Gp37/Gp68 family protein [Mesorhizobium sp.]|uniref:DUF5131 family protein n=1 Tax=Mesorhizobium sp. TaxID=1871066 RepID=UPI000FE5D483|nr:phage Gp37/Gp68 family protein [Mesorhizobium sp.]RWO23308.1 MAG: phage Gp37/Gp68 family protein [Mesorhizobium sp.]